MICWVELREKGMPTKHVGTKLLIIENTLR